MLRKLAIGILVLSFSGQSLGVNPRSGAAQENAWEDFWKSVNVAPPPPRDFLEGEFTGKVLNLTDHRVDDATVKAWILADLRRGRGDSYAGYHLRRDIADANIFGPPGLNGTGDGIDGLRARGVVRMDPNPMSRVVVAAVLRIPPERPLGSAPEGFTEYVIVLGYTLEHVTLVYRDGRQEPHGPPPPPDAIAWQLDTGHYFEHATLGALWYQKDGYTCIPGAASLTGQICGRVKQEADKLR